MFKHLVTSESELRELFGYPGERAILKQQAVLDEHSRAFIARSPFLVLATSNAAGQCDVSPKGDVPGFVHVLDDTHLVVPDRPGNKRLDGMRNLLENPHVGLLFIVPGREETLRVNGRGHIVKDEELLERLVVMGKRPTVAIGVEVEECYLHCAKAFKRSGLWQTESWAGPATLPSMSRVLWRQISKVKPLPMTVEEYERDSESRLKQLY
jgi:PPOX class probable FMN-dependent enzyme